MSSDANVIEVVGLSKCYTLYDRPSDRLRQFVLPRLQALLRIPRRRYYREFWALSDVNMTIRTGETVGIVGRNGAGKSTLLQLICGTLNPTSGSVAVRGRVAALLELGSGFNPEFTGLENIATYAAVLGLTKAQIDDKLDDILSFADIGDFVRQPVKTYSSGMMVRLAFAVASAVEPEVLIVDEALSVGDLAFQNKCLRRIRQFIDGGGTTLFVSHSPSQVSAFCDRAYWIHDGKVREEGAAKGVVTSYVNFMRDGFQAAAQKPAAAKAATADGHWTLLGASHQIDSRPGHVIEAFSLELAGSGQPLSVVVDLPVRLRLRVRVRTSGVEQPLLGVGLFGTLNLPIIHFNSAALGADLPPLAADGPAVLSVEFELPRVADGEYVLHLGLDDGEPGDSIMLCHVRAAMTLVVATRGLHRFRQYGVIPIDESHARVAVES